MKGFAITGKLVGIDTDARTIDLDIPDCCRRILKLAPEVSEATKWEYLLGEDVEAVVIDDVVKYLDAVEE